MGISHNDCAPCRYRGQIIGWLVRGSDGFLKYVTNGFRPFAAAPRYLTQDQVMKLRAEWEAA